MLHTSIGKPRQRHVWRDLQELQGLELATTMPSLTPEQLTMQSGRPDEAGLNWFIKRQTDPNRRLASPGYRAGQSFSNPRLAIVENSSGYILGFGLAAYNVSGSPIARLIKRSGVVPDKKYLWIEGIHVRPDIENRPEVVNAVGRALLKSGGDQPVTTYVWPFVGEGNMLDTYNSWGFTKTSEQYVKPFGQGGPEVTEFRLQAASASLALRRLIKTQ